MEIAPLKHTIQQWARSMKNFWQLVFVLVVLTYGPAMYYELRFHPGPKPAAFAHLTTWQNVAFFVAIFLLVAIMLIKRRYFSRQFSRQYFETAFAQQPHASSKAILQRFLSELRPKLIIIWFLAFLVNGEGVLLYWVTGSARYLHILFIVCLFSLVVNYPRTDWFMDWVWQVEKIRIQKQEEQAGLE